MQIKSKANGVSTVARRSEQGPSSESEEDRRGQLFDGSPAQRKQPTEDLLARTRIRNKEDRCVAAARHEKPDREADQVRARINVRSDCQPE